MLSETPELAKAGFARAVVLGERERVRAELDRDPGLASRVDAESGWTPLAGFTRNAVPALRLLLEHVPDVAGTAGKALAAPINGGDIECVRVLLDAGADPRRFRDDDGRPASALHAAVAARCPAEVLELLLLHGADANAVDEHGRSAYRAATTAGRGDVVDLLRAHGARDDTTPLDRLLWACIHADEAAARRELAADPGLLDSPAEALGRPALSAAEAGGVRTVELALRLGFPIGARVGEDGATLLHVAAYAGSADVVELLLARGADVEARDAHWDDTPLSWAGVGSGERPATNPEPDWPRTVRVLLDAGASTDGITFSPDDPKPPSREVADILRTHVSDLRESPS